MLKLSIVALLAGFGMLVWIVVSRLSSDAIGLALGVVFGMLSLVPGLMMVAAGRRREPEERIVYRDRVVYRIAGIVYQFDDEPELPKRPTAQLADDWLADCLDTQAQVQLGVTPRQIEKRQVRHAN